MLQHWYGCPRTFGLIFKKTVDFGRCSVKHHDFETMVGNIQNQVLAHDSQTDQAKISAGDDPHRSADIDAGKTGAAVSQLISIRTIQQP